VQGAGDIADLPAGERNQFFRMVLVGPTRAQLLGWMAKPWLPKLDFGHSGGMAERVGDALAEGWREFRGFD
jgi:hypothetical protein